MLSQAIFNHPIVKKATGYVGTAQNLASSIKAGRNFLFGSPEPDYYRDIYPEPTSLGKRELDTFDIYSYMAAMKTDVKNIKLDNVDPSLNANGHSVIRIQPNRSIYTRTTDLKPILGVLNSELSYTINSEWEEQGFPLPITKGFTELLSSFTIEGGSGEMGQVYKSKLLWRKSGRLEIEPKFRIVDWEGDGMPIKVAIMAQKYALPVPRVNRVSDFLSKNEAKLKQLMGTLRQKPGDIGSIQNEILGLFEQSGIPKNTTTQFIEKHIAAGISEGNEFISKFANGSIGDVGRDFIVNATEDLHDLVMLQDTPPPVIIQIGQFFYHPDMVVENVTVNFSEEKSEMGPLYVDISMKLKSRKLLQGYGDTGLFETKNSRINNKIKGTLKSPYLDAIPDWSMADIKKQGEQIPKEMSPADLKKVGEQGVPSSMSYSDLKKQGEAIQSGGKKPMRFYRG